MLIGIVGMRGLIVLTSKIRGTVNQLILRKTHEAVFKFGFQNNYTDSQLPWNLLGIISLRTQIMTNSSCYLMNYGRSLKVSLSGVTT